MSPGRGFAMEEERHDYPRYREIERMSRRLSLPQISRLLKRNETLGDPFSFSSGTPPSRPLNSPPRIRKHAHLTALSLPGRLLTKVFSLITRHREIYVSGGRFFSLDVSCHDFRGSPRGRGKNCETLRRFWDSAFPRGEAFTVASLSLSLP